MPNRVRSDLHRPDASERDAKTCHAGLDLELEAGIKVGLYSCMRRHSNIRFTPPTAPVTSD